MKKLVLGTCMGALMAMAAPAIAGPLDGQTLGWTYFYPDSSTTYDAGTFSTSSPSSMQGLFTFSATGNAVVTSNFCCDEDGWTPAPFNGFQISDINGTIAAFTGVSIDPSSNMAGLDMSRVSWDANNIFVNWQGLNWDTNTVVKFDISAGGVPEPASWALMLGGFGMVGGAMRSRRKAAVSFG